MSYIICTELSIWVYDVNTYVTHIYNAFGFWKRNLDIISYRIVDVEYIIVFYNMVFTKCYVYVDILQQNLVNKKCFNSDVLQCFRNSL